MSGADGRGGPPLIVPDALNLASFNDILFMLERNLIVDENQYVCDHSLFSLL